MNHIDAQLAKYRVGPRGGVYYIDWDGTRRYVDRDTIQRLEAAKAARRYINAMGQPSKALKPKEKDAPANPTSWWPATLLTFGVLFTLHGTGVLISRAEAAIGSTVQTFQPLEALAWLVFFVIAGAAMWRKA